MSDSHSNKTNKRWISEKLYSSVYFTFAADKIYFEEQTEEQHLIVFDNHHFGRVMMLDGVTQVTEKDEFIYHEMLSHVPIFAHGDVQSVLIIGGGDGGIAREVLRHQSIKKVTQVEIDGTVIDFAKTHFPMIMQNAYDDERFNLIIGDGCEFVKKSTEKFDVIIVDSTDPHGPGEVLFTKEFYSYCEKSLTDKGILVTQNGVPFMQGDELTQSVKYFREIFKVGTCYLASIPTYVGGFMALGFATNDKSNLNKNLADLQAQFEKSNFDCKYYTPEIHNASFVLPKFIQELIA